jgi:predicted regulator of Ras-like GTPase activity (Roadblock/LC7/MglB family)
MDAAQALADLREISSQIQAAVVFDEGAAVVASTVEDEERSRTLVGAAVELLEAASAAAPGEGQLVQLEAATGEGSVFVVRDSARNLVATTGPEPTVGLVFYDLKSCLRALDAQPPKRPRKRKTTAPKDAPAEETGDAA